jgi:hypothetical protein
MLERDNEFAESVAEKLATMAHIINCEASLIRAHRWSKVNWNYLKRKLSFGDGNRLFEIARRRPGGR